MKYIFRYESCNNLTLNNLRHGEFYFTSADEVNDPTEAVPLLRFKGNNDLWDKLVDFILLNTILEIIDYSTKDGKKFTNMVMAEQQKISLKLRKVIGRRAITPTELTTIFSQLIFEHFKSFKPSRDIQFLVDYLPTSIDKHIISILNKPKKFFVSFSRDALNPTMWGHYANSYKGYCLIFKPSNNQLKIVAPEAGFNFFLNLGDDGKKKPRNESELDLFPITYKKTPPYGKCISLNTSQIFL